MIDNNQSYPAQRSTDGDNIVIVERVSTLQGQVKLLTEGQAEMREAIVKMAENLSFMQRLESRVISLESKTNKMVGGLILSSVITPIVVTGIVTAILFYTGR